MLFVALAAAVLPTFAVAEQVLTVQVGQGGLKFNPQNVDNVQNGDIVQFVFDTPGHSVTQSTLADPCAPVQGGFSSGFSTSAGEVWNLTVADASKPIWYFCAQTAPAYHCQAGMVGAINSPSDKLNSFIGAASAASPTQSFTDIALSGSGAAATASITSAAAVSDVVTASGSGSGAGASGSPSGSSASSTPSSAAMPFAGFEAFGATFLALFGALLF